MAEDERSLQKRENFSHDQIEKGGLIIGSLDSSRGSLMSMTGMALERITRERTELPPEMRLPERPVYLLDPNARRLIMISNRELPFPYSHARLWKGGLFAEIVELDDLGEPKFTLSTPEVILSSEEYRPVAVGPNKFKMPPSFIEMEEKDEFGKNKFVPWNVYLADLQTWMNEITLDSGDSFESFMDKFTSLRKKAKKESVDKVNKNFPGSSQGFDETVAPFNLIIGDEVGREYMEMASREAGLFPVFVSAKDFILKEQEKNEGYKKAGTRFFNLEDEYRIAHYLPASWDSEAKRYTPALITHDWNATWRLREEKEFVEKVISPEFLVSTAINEIIRNNPIFCYGYMMMPEAWEVRKDCGGQYFLPQSNEKTYREFLYKVKADLLLTMFVRGGAPIVK